MNARLCQCCINRPRVRLQLVPHVHRRACVRLILDLGFCERSAIVHAPIHRAETFIDETLFEELVERANHDRLVLGRHRRVWLVPAS